MSCIWIYGGDFCWCHRPSGFPHPSLQKASCWLWGLFVFAFVMRCHLVPLAVSGLLVSPCDTHHEYDNTFLAFSLLIGQRQTPPQYIFSYTAASHWPPCFPKPSSSLGSCSILMRQARLCFLHLLVVLWSCGAGGEGCRPGSGIRSRRRRRLQPCQFAVSWTACEKKQKKNSHGHVAERWWWGLRLRLWAG